MSFLRAPIQEVIQWFISGEQLNATHILPILVEAVHVNSVSCTINTLIFQSFEVRLRVCPDQQDAVPIAVVIVCRSITRAPTHPWNGLNANEDLGSQHMR